MEKIAALIIILVFILGIIMVSVLAIRWARKSSRRAAFIGWGLQFLGAGINPQPPPQERLEAVSRQTRIKMDAESGDPEE
jgi:hypothetical protein